MKGFSHLEGGEVLDLATGRCGTTTIFFLFPIGLDVTNHPLEPGSIREVVW